ncbi:coiled-coil domain-containing protein 149 [Odontomachus brunneus]|uniref:coiled-coil domain-containing protein 149 n=1 Tax=Odontomachus brunneus TaxID=486640 RepID=UPI0013F1D460|nr:coiled-coil domain-containing protein 149 [Odontomachus brunneus]
MEEKSDQIKENNDNNIDIESKTILKRKLQMKSEALMLLSQELDQCRIQRDQFKLMAEQIQERFLHLKKQMCDTKELNRCYNLDDDFRTLDLLTEAREQNKCLRLQVETLRQKLGDAEGDIKALRMNNNRVSVEQQDVQVAPSMHQREEMIEQLEKLNLKCSQLQTDLQTVLDEKHELGMERDAFKCKAHRLNHELSKALNASKPVDLDALINENRYLQERLQQLLEEKELTRQSLSKYKSMLDSKRTKGAIKLGANSAVGTVMTHKQVEQLLQESSYIPPQKSAAAVTDLRCLCTALLEALNDKTLALAHQKKANKILALRICELDSAVQSPTMRLLEGYTSANVDLRCDNEFNDLDHTNNCGADSIEETNIITNKSNVQCSSSPENQVIQQLQSIQMSLPKNLGILVQKALNNLKDNDKQKI